MSIMNHKLYLFASLIFAVIISQSCSNDGEVLHKNITGNTNELLVVISNESWEGKPGKIIRNTLGQSQVALPQDEPMFDLINVPKQGFKSIFRSTRNILQVNISSAVSQPEVLMKDDIWAYPQATAIINVKDIAEFEKVYMENQDKIMSYFLAAEKERLTMNYQKYYEKAVYNVLDKDFGLTMKVPPGFKIADQKEEFIWFKYETPDISQGIILYTFPYVSDSAFTVNYQLRVRDSILKANIPGPTKGSFMSTEKRIEQVNNYLEHNGNYASEMRGLWRLINDYMGGPYISLAQLDAANQRVVVAFGYVYAPSKDKRNFIKQVEAMIYSLKLNDQKKSDKIKSEINMGN